MMRRRSIAAAVVLLCAPLGFGCGRKSAPLPPEDVVPATITDLAATNAAAGVQLSWTRPTRYADDTRMADLAGFLVTRCFGNEPPSAMQQIADLQVNDRDRFRQIKRFRYIDGDTIVGAPYRYQVVSYTLDGYVSASSNVATIERTAASEGSNAPLPTPQQ